MYVYIYIMYMYVCIYIYTHDGHQAQKSNPMYLAICLSGFIYRSISLSLKQSIYPYSSS